KKFYQEYRQAVGKTAPRPPSGTPAAVGVTPELIEKTNEAKKLKETTPTFEEFLDQRFGETIRLGTFDQESQFFELGLALIEKKIHEGKDLTPQERDFYDGLVRTR